MNEYTLPRTGQRPIKFTGELIANSTREPVKAKDKDKLRYYELSIYKTESEKYIAVVVYHTEWEDEEPRQDVMVCETAHEVADVLEDYDSSLNVVGFPPGQQFAARQERLLDSLRSQYEQQVSEVLAKLPDSADIVE